MVDLFLDPKIWLLILVLSIIGSFARLGNYYLGVRGKDKIRELYPRIQPETWEKVMNWYQRVGSLPLLVASIPFIGSVLTIGAGMAGVKRTNFLVWVAISKVIRNWILVIVIWYLV